MNISKYMADVLTGPVRLSSQMNMRGTLEEATSLCHF